MEVAKRLDGFGIDYVVKEHQTPAFTCEDVARERNTSLNQVLKCMVGKGANGDVYVMLIPRDKRLNINRVRHINNGVK